MCFYKALYAFLFSLICEAWSAHLIILDFIIEFSFGEQYKL
jgi:hypothetical protein